MPSILSLVYSNIPQIKKGTDSRVGFGFRLGEHADFQIQLELGPQLNTKPIGKLSEDTNLVDSRMELTAPTRAAAGSSKRYVDNEEYANSVRNPTRNGGSTSWLQAWSKQTKQRQQFNKDKLRDSLMPPAPVMDEGAYNQLQQLYEMNKQREYEDSIGTLPAEVLETRINQLKALHSPQVTPFRPMPSEPRSGVAGASEEKQSPSESMIIVVTPEVQVESTTTTAPTAESTTVVSERIKVRESTGGPTVDSGRRNVRRRTNRPVSKWDKERITAQLSDVSLD
uniref:Zasp-like motif domain-containing protein n=1 Tax=Anopheles stephensi TaxID=30069 RepID=A0A182YDN8_ANOST